MSGREADVLLQKPSHGRLNELEAGFAPWKRNGRVHFIHNDKQVRDPETVEKHGMLAGLRSFFHGRFEFSFAGRDN